MECPEERDARMEGLLNLQHQRAKAKLADWSRPTKFDGFWRHPKLNAKLNSDSEMRSDRTPQWHNPDTEQRIQYMK